MSKLTQREEIELKILEQYDEDRRKREQLEKLRKIEHNEAWEKLFYKEWCEVKYVPDDKRYDNEYTSKKLDDSFIFEKETRKIVKEQYETGMTQMIDKFLKLQKSEEKKQ